MSERVLVGTIDEIPPGDFKAIVHDDKPIAVFNVDGVYFAISNICPHAAGPLGQGFIENGRIVCPWHGWSFPSARRTRRTTVSRVIGSWWMEMRYALNSPRSRSTKAGGSGRTCRAGRDYPAATARPMPILSSTG